MLPATNLDRPMPAEHRRVFREMLKYIRAVRPDIFNFDFRANFPPWVKQGHTYGCLFGKPGSYGFAAFDPETGRTVIHVKKYDLQPSWV